jgi:hypothetical protein
VLFGNLTGADDGRAQWSNRLGWGGWPLLKSSWVQFAEQLPEELRQKPHLTLEKLRTRLGGELSAATILA